MARRIDSEPTRWASIYPLIIGLASSTIVYFFTSMSLNPSNISLSNGNSNSNSNSNSNGNGNSNSNSNGESEKEKKCCRGIDNLELWGAAVKWGSEFKFNTSEECCGACKKMCEGNDGPCLCDSWVFCGDREACGPHFGECWLKKQKDSLAPEQRHQGTKVSWTSGLIFGKGEGIVGFETEHGTLNVKLLPECAPHSVAYILELLESRHCAGCQFYRAEGHGQLWDSQGHHINNASFGPPYALVQGTLQSLGTTFREIASEVCRNIMRGSVAWVGSGPEFFISLANHKEWRNEYTVFGSVLPEDMEIAEKIARLETKPDVWNNVHVTVLENPVPLRIRRIKSSAGTV